MSQQTGAWATRAGLPNAIRWQNAFQQQSWPAPAASGASLNLSAWHAPQFGYFNSTQQDLCGAAFRVGIDNTCFAGGPVTPAMLSPPFSKNPGAYNMDTGKYLFQLTQPVPPLTGMSTSEVLVQDKDVGTSGL